MDENEIYKRMLNGDTTSLEKIIDLYGEAVYRLVARILGSVGTSGDIEECCSDAFAAAWEKKENFNPNRGSLRTWILILARYKALDWRRKHQRQQKIVQLEDTESYEVINLLADTNTPEEQLIANEVQSDIQKALSSLPVEDKKILYMRYFLEDSVEQIASELGISRGAADTRLWRARQLLKKNIDKSEKVVPING